jgi:hypothetical protein
VQVPLRVGDDGVAHVRVPALDAVQRIAAAQKATAGPLVYHKVSMIDSRMWTDAEQARQRWIRNQQDAWQRNRSTQLPFPPNIAVRSDGKIDINTDNRPANATNTDNSDKAYQRYCRRLEDGWRGHDASALRFPVRPSAALCFLFVTVRLEVGVLSFLRT